jgi:hypothetical protein
MIAIISTLFPRYSHVIPPFLEPQKTGDTGVFPMAQVVCGQFLDAAVIGVVFAQ